jgi:hypothetical protein
MIALMADSDDPNAARLREILRGVVSDGFGGNQRRAADALGVTQPLLSQVLAKGSTQRVGPALVFAVVSMPWGSSTLRRSASPQMSSTSPDG